MGFPQSFAPKFGVVGTIVSPYSLQAGWLRDNDWFLDVEDMVLARLMEPKGKILILRRPGSKQY